MLDQQYWHSSTIFDSGPVVRNKVLKFGSGSNVHVSSRIAKKYDKKKKKLERVECRNCYTLPYGASGTKIGPKVTFLITHI